MLKAAKSEFVKSIGMLRYDPGALSMTRNLEKGLLRFFFHRNQRNY